jgi:hypothetical protein
MTKVVKQRKGINLDELEQKDMNEDLVKLASWHLELEPPQTSNAISLYQEVLQRDPNNYESFWKLFELFVQSGKLDEGSALLKSTSVRSKKDPSLTQLGEMLLNYEFITPIETFDLVFRIAKRDNTVSEILETLDQVIKTARNQKKESVLGSLLLINGVALAYHQEVKAVDSALTNWEESCSLGFKMGIWSAYEFIISASRYLSLSYWATVRAAHKLGTDPSEYISKLEVYSRQGQEVHIIGYHIRVVLAACYTLLSDQEKAMQNMRSDMKTAMDLLSDDDPDNDHQAYLMIADVLMHCGDDLNALSSWSLLGPNDLESPKETEHENGVKEGETAQADGVPDTSPKSKIIPNRRGDMGNTCDGRCGKNWTYADDIWCCKVCPDVQFDSGCLDKVRNGTLDRYICSSEHEWLHVPPWSDENYAKVGKNNVQIGGTLKDGERVGGQVVPVKEWLDGLRKTWEIPVATPSSPLAEIVTP